MKVNSALLGPCGLYCGVCAIYIAGCDNNLKFKERLVNLYNGGIPGKGKLHDSENLSANDIKYSGCLSDDVFIYCKQCEIKNCTTEKGYTGCHQCDQFPCGHIEDFPMTVGKKVIQRAIPYWQGYRNDFEQFKKLVAPYQNRFEEIQSSKFCLLPTYRLKIS